MGSFLCKQPNGLYCRFSTIVDCPTDWNMTEEDYINMKMEQAKRDAQEVLKNHIQPFEMIAKYYRPFNMTQKDFDKFNKEVCESVESDS